MIAPCDPFGDGRRRVLCVGETMALVTPIKATPLREATTFAIKAAGAESTVAMYLADSGCDAAWASRIGDDPLGQRLLGEIASAGVNVDGAEVVGTHPTGVFFKDPGEGTTTVHYYRAGSAASTMDESFVASLDWQGVGLLHVTGITPALSDTCAALVPELMDTARERGVVVSFDVNYRPALWARPEAAAVLARLCRQAHLVFVGRDEAENLWGAVANDPVALRDQLGITGSLVLKDGAIGATEVDAGGQVTFVPAPEVSVVEAVGAGDAFSAGYLAALLGRGTATQRLAQGHAFAARALSSTQDFVPARVAAR